MRQLDTYIEKLQTTEPSPFLVTRIMDGVENQKHKRISVLKQSLALVASVAIIVMLGISLGNNMSDDAYLTINDNQIENFSILTSDDIQ